MSMGRRGVLILAVVFATSCSMFGPRAEPPSERADRETVARASALRESGQPAQAHQALSEFLSANPNSSYLQAARLEEARCLEDLGRAAEAGVIYRDVREKTLGREPRLAAQAEWRLSFTAEAGGEDLKAFSHLLSAERLKENLPESTAKAEVPARKAQLLQKLGRDEDAAKAVTEAERGLRELLAGPKAKPDDEWMANLYLEMGRSLARSVDAANFAGYLKAQKNSQVYLIKAMSYRDAPAAPKAFEILRANYGEFWNFIRNVQGDDDGGDPVLATRMKREKQIPLLAEFLKVVEEARALRVDDDDENPLEKDFFSLTEDLAAKARRVLYASPASTILTEESRLLNGLRRGVVPAGPAEPAVKSDPNL